MKRFLSFLLILCLIVGLLPAVAFPKAQAAVETATLSVFGYNKTVTAGGEPLYWVNGEGTAMPVVATATDNWNYSLAIVDGDVVFTMRNAEYSYSAAILYAKMDGNLRVKYEGVNNININKTLSQTRYFVKHIGSAAGKAYLYLQGGEDDVLNVSGGGNTTGLLHTEKSKLYITGGTVNLEKTAGANYPVIYCHYVGMEIKNCNLNVTQLGTSGVAYPAIYGAYNATNHHFIIQDSNVTVKGPNTVGICAGVFLASLKGTTDTANLYIKGKSDVKIELNTPDANLNGTYKSYRYMGSGIYCKGLYIQGGSLEVTSRKHAINFTADATVPDLSGYTTDYPYEMFTAKDGEAVTEYTRTGYFKLAAILPCEHKNTTTSEAVTLEPTCGATGIKTFTVTCSDCGEVADTWEVALPATNEHTYDAVTGVCSGCGDVEIPIEGPTWPEDVVFATAEQMANVVVEKKASAGGSITAHPGGRITYKILITNNNAEAINVHIEDLIPKDTTLVSGCDYTSGRALYFVEKDIAPSETRIVTYNVKPDYTVNEVRASENDIVLTNTDAKVMDETVPAPTKDIWVLETFNADDRRRMEHGIDSLIAANLTVKNSAGQSFSGATLISQMYGVAFSKGVSINSTANGLNRIFDIYGSSTATADDLIKAQKQVDMMVPCLYGGTSVPASKDSLFRGARAISVSINDLITGDVIYMSKDGVDKTYIVRGNTLVCVGSDAVIHNIDPDTVLPSLPTCTRYAVIRPSINLLTSYSLNEDEFYNEADKSEYSDLEKALIATAETYWLRGDRTQYDTSMMSSNEFRKEPLTKNPEDYTVDQYGYLDCSTFTYDLHWVTYGYAANAPGPNGNTLQYNRCERILDCMSVGWNPETMTGSNKSAILYYETKATYTDAEKQAIHDEIASVLRPGDLIVYEYADGSGGHIMAYVGRGLLIHCTGGSFPKGGTYDSHEASIRCMNVDDLFDPEIYSHGHLFTKTTRFGVCRPQNLTTPRVTENTANRVANMQGIVGEKVSSTAMGKTVNPGDTITYTFYVYNTNAEAKVITINDVLGEYVTFVSATDGGTVSGSNVYWSFTVPANTRLSVSYTVKVKGGVADYTAIDGTKATINGVRHKCYNTYVVNTLTTSQQQALLDAVDAVRGMDRTGLNVVSVAELIYKTAFGVDDLFGEQVNSLSELIGNIVEDDARENIGVFNDTNYWNGAIVSLMDKNPSKPALMVAPGMYGGTYVYSSKYQDEGYNRYQTMGGTTLRSRYFWEKDLVVGDLFFLRGSTASYFYIYVGNNTLVNLTNMQEYPAREWIQRAPDTSKWHYYAVLRPSITLEMATECEHIEEIIPGKAATCTETGLTEGKQCSVCGEILVAQEEIPALGHSFTDADDADCNNCDYIRPVADALSLDESNKLVFADDDARNLYHRVVVYYLGDKTVSDITLTNNLLKIDPNAKTYWGIGEINKVQLLQSGNYVVHLFYNTAGSAKIKVAKQFTVEANEPTLTAQGGKLNVVDEDAAHIYHRAVVYYLGDQTVEDIYDEAALQAIDSTAKTYWGLSRINNIRLQESGNYVVLLHYNYAGSKKLTVAMEVTY